MNLELLCQSPTSLNLIRGSNPHDQIKRLVMNYLPKIPGIINESFLQFYDQSIQSQEELAEVLNSMEPLHPRIMAFIYESTPTGVAQKITRRVQNTRTMELMMNEGLDAEIREWGLQDYSDSAEGPSRRKPRPLTQLTDIYESNQLHSFLLISNQTEMNRLVLEKCSTCHARELRQESWGKDLKGVTVAVPMELLIPDPSTDCAEDNHLNPHLGYIRCQTSWTVGKTPYDLTNSIGPFKPFFGSKTEEKVKYESGKLIAVSPPLSLKVSLKPLD